MGQDGMIVDLNSLIYTNIADGCGLFAFKLVDESHSALVSTALEGQVRPETVSDSNLVGNYTVAYEVYMLELDPSALYTWPIDVNLHISILEE